MTAITRVAACPDAGAFGATANADNVRGSLQALRYIVMFEGNPVPGFDVATTYDGSNRLSVRTYTEQTAHAAADTPPRAGAARWIMRMTYTYNGAGQLEKIRGETSVNNGTTFINWTDLAGNSFYNFTYTSGRLTGENWSAS